MSANLTELVLILDRSGSMGGLEEDTIGGFNALLAKQKKEPGAARVTTVLFDNQYDILHDRLELQAVQPLTEGQYFVRGSTALLDAIYRSIRKVDGVMEGTAPGHRPDRVLFAIITDSMENASHLITREQLARLVAQRREMGWEFLFLGANMDAITVAGSYGIEQSRAATWIPDQEGVELNFQALDAAVTQMRHKRQVSEDWASPVRKRGAKDT
ncbi:MAG: VWA domain-containing protein [Clostridiales bacterium]|nr:VWA domain-containing protein [Clostridiales bacterium]